MGVGLRVRPLLAHVRDAAAAVLRRNGGLVHAQVCPADTDGTCPRTDNMHSGNFVNFQCQ